MKSTPRLLLKGIEMKKIFLIPIILSFLLFLFFNLKAPLRIQGDGVFYYAYLHSSFFDRDFDFKNQLARFSSQDYFSQKFLSENKLTAVGKTPNAYPPGVAIMWIPFFLLAHFLTWIFRLPLDGYSYFYVFFLNFSAWLFGILALILNYKNLRKFFSEKNSFVPVLAVWLATPWIYYQFLAPSMNHMASLFLASFFLFLTMQEWREKKKSRLLMPVVFLMVLTRWQNIFFVLFYAPVFLKNKKKILNILIPILAFALIQSLIWKNLYGRYFLIPQGHRFVGFQFHGLYTLFSSDRGLLLWSPVIILALIGLVYLWKKCKFLTLIAILILLCQWILNSSLNDPGGGEAFGARRFIETLSLLIFPLAAFWEKWQKKKIILFLFLFLILGNFLLLENYRLGYIPRSGKFRFFQINLWQAVEQDLNKINPMAP